MEATVQKLVDSIGNLIESQTQLGKKFELAFVKLEEKQAALELQVSHLTDLVNSFLDQSKSNPPPPINPDTRSHLSATEAAFAAAYTVAANRPQHEAKAQRMVILNVTERPTERETAEADQQLVKSIVESLNLKDLNDAFNADAVHFHRHPRERPEKQAGDTRPYRRPLKIELGDIMLRNQVLDRIRFSGKPAALRPFPGSYVRRDMTYDELKIERAQKIKSHELNTIAGQVEYGVRDLELIKYSRPRPFTRRN